MKQLLETIWTMPAEEFLAGISHILYGFVMLTLAVIMIYKLSNWPRKGGK